MNAVTPIAAHDTPAPVVVVQDGRLFTDSRNVAAMFGKRHANVLRDIRGLLNFEETPSPKDLFVESSYVDPQNGRIFPCYMMDRDGFALLAMGFTGERALRWKLAYSQAFNLMERQLRDMRASQPAIGIDVRDPGQLAIITTQLLAMTSELKARAETAEAEVAVKSEQLAIAAPKVEAFDAFMSTGKNENLRSVARLCKAQSSAWFAWAKDRGFIFYESGVLQPRADLRSDGYMVVKQAPDDDGIMRPQTLVTPAGQVWIQHRWAAHLLAQAKKADAENQARLPGVA